MPRSKVSERLNRAVGKMPNSVFSIYATISTCAIAALVAIVWCSLCGFLFFVFPFTRDTYMDNLVVNTWINNGTRGEVVYAMKAREWVEEYAPCSSENLSEALNVWGAPVEDLHIAPMTIRMRDVASQCAPEPDEDAEDGAVVNFQETYSRFVDATENSTNDAQSIWNERPLMCECTTNGFNFEDSYNTWTSAYFIAAKHKNVNGWNEVLDFQETLGGNVYAKRSFNKMIVTCCSCVYTNETKATDHPLRDYCGDDGTKDREHFFQGGAKLDMMIGWDIIHFIVMTACACLAGMVIGMRRFLKEHLDIFLIGMAIAIPSYTISGAAMMHCLYGFELLPKASGQLIVAVTTLVVMGRMLGKRVIQNTDVDKISMRYYVWSIIGASGISVFVGPFLITVAVGKVYVHPDTSNAVRTFIAVFATPLVFWLICTGGRFAAYDVSKYGREKHAVTIKHVAFACYLCTQSIFAVYNRMFVAGQSGSTDVVGYSLAKRSDLFIAAFLSSTFGILARVTTQYRDRWMYYCCHLGKKQLPKDFFEDKNVAQFLKCDMLIWEAMVDSVSLSVVTWMVCLVEIWAGVPPTEAVTAGIINWVIQMTFEQLGNYAIFLLRDRGGHITETKISPAIEDDSVGNSSASSTGSSSSAVLVRRNGNARFQIVNSKVLRVVSHAWWLLLISPFITVLLIRVVGPNTMRMMEAGG